MRPDGYVGPRRATKLKVQFLSGVDAPAHEGADVSIIKFKTGAKEPDAMQPVLKTIFSQALAEKQYERDAEELLCQAYDYSLNSALREAAETIGKDPMLDDAGKQAALRAAVDEYIVRLHSAMIGTPITKNTHKEADMADEKIMAELAELRKERDLHKALSELSDVQKAHYATLGESEQVEFLKGSRTVPADESFTDVDGSVIAKSAVGAGAFQVLKQQNARLAKMQDDLDMQTLTKRAETELKHLPGEVVAKARVLKAIDKMPEAERATLDQILKAADAAAAPGFKPAAVAGEAQGDTAMDKIMVKARALAAEKSVSMVKAQEMVLATPEGQELYNAHQKGE